MLIMKTVAFGIQGVQKKSVCEANFSVICKKYSLVTKIKKITPE